MAHCIGAAGVSVADSISSGLLPVHMMPILERVELSWASKNTAGLSLKNVASSPSRVALFSSRLREGAHVLALSGRFLPARAIYQLGRLAAGKCCIADGGQENR
jgi:hypothetical protein